MSKSKKPAEDKSKAGAVTNSIANEVDDILGQFARFKHEIVAGVQSGSPVLTKDEAKCALLTLIADRERKARVEELEDLEFIDWESYGDKPRTNYDTGINELIDPLVANYVKDRIKQLQAEDKES